MADIGKGVHTNYKIYRIYKYFNHFQAKRSKTVLTDDNNKTLFFPANFQGCSSGGLGEISPHLHLLPLSPSAHLIKTVNFGGSITDSYVLTI